MFGICSKNFFISGGSVAKALRGIAGFLLGIGIRRGCFANPDADHRRTYLLNEIGEIRSLRVWTWVSGTAAARAERSENIKSPATKCAGNEQARGQYRPAPDSASSAAF